jgi:hypothetical protein
MPMRPSFAVWYEAGSLIRVWVGRGESQIQTKWNEQWGALPSVGLE